MSDKPDPTCFDPYTYKAPMGPEQEARAALEQKQAVAPPAPVPSPGADPYPGGEPGAPDASESLEGAPAQDGSTDPVEMPPPNPAT